MNKYTSRPPIPPGLTVPYPFDGTLRDKMEWAGCVGKAKQIISLSSKEERKEAINNYKGDKAVLREHVRFYWEYVNKGARNERD
ncbi:MAG: hypothetical protein V4629_03195 [Pseudomonadota bacterium]